MEISRMVPTPRMTWDEIRVAFPDQYVIMDDLVIDDGTRFACAGRVIAHGPTRREAFAAEPPRTANSHTALRYTGEPRIPPGFTGLYIFE